MIKVVVEVGDFNMLTQEEALVVLARMPDLLESPRSVLLEPRYVSSLLQKLLTYFTPEQVRDLVGNNPGMFLERWQDIKDRLDFMQYKMNVSAHRISVTPDSVIRPVSFLQARYNFLNLSGNYLHPDPSAKSARPIEASPALHLITDTSDERFVGKCCPGLSMEEWTVFLAIQYQQEVDEIDEDGDVEDDVMFDPDIHQSEYRR